MEVQKDFKCKTCEAQLTALAEEAQNGLVTCPYCKNVWTIPKKETSPAALSFLRMGEHDLDTCKFEDALSAYQKAAELDKEEPEAYFGMALATYKVQYLKDEVADPPRLQPICHEISEKVFSADKNYLKAVELATREQKRIYRERAMEIDEIRDRFEELKESGLDYDCFLCVKVSSEDGGTTQDSHEALRIYNYLKEKGYTPFYSEAIMGERMGSDYEAHILYALYTSECMLIVCSDEEYLKTKWVKNEYTRFSAMIANEEKERDAVTFVYRGKPIEKLPGRNGKLQGIDLAKPTAYAAIADYVERHTPAAKARREAEEKKRRAEEEARSREFSELKEKLAQMERERASAASPANLSPAELLAMMRKAEEEEKNQTEEERRQKEIERRHRQLEERRKQEEERRQKAEEEKRKREEAMAEDQRKRLEAARARLEESRKRSAEESKRKEYLLQFQIEGGVLKKYKGTATDVLIPNSVASIEKDAFAGCALTSIAVEEGNPVLHAAGNCLIQTKAKTLIMGCKNSTIPEDGSVTSIGKDAFRDCKELTAITIPSSVTSIGDWAFSGCEKLARAAIPEGVTSIGREAFECCDELADVSLPQSLREIGEDAFSECAKLYRITIPEGVEEIGEGAFEGSPLQGGALKEVVWNAVDCSSAERIFPQSVVSVVFGKDVKRIPDSAFSECILLKHVVLPKGLTEIGDCAFYNCSSLLELKIPKSVISIGGSAFANCSELVTIAVEEGNPIFHSSGNCLVATAQKALISGCKNSTIPADGSVTSIEDRAFAGCYHLTSISIPSGMLRIGAGAFEGCALSQISIPESVTSIGEGAFSGCTLAELVLPPRLVVKENERCLTGCTVEHLTTPMLGDYRLCYALFVKKDVEDFRFHPVKTIEITGGRIYQAGLDGFDGLETLIIHNGVEIEDYILGNVTSVRNVTIPQRFKGFMSSGLKKIFGDRFKQIKFTFI